MMNPDRTEPIPVSPPRRSGRHWHSGEQPIVSHAGRGPGAGRMARAGAAVAIVRDLAIIAVLLWLLSWLVRTGGP